MYNAPCAMIIYVYRVHMGCFKNMSSPKCLKMFEHFIKPQIRTEHPKD